MATSRFPILITLILCGLPLHGQDLQGAEAILKRLAERAENPGDSKDPAQLLKKQVESFVAESGKLPPEKAAATWLALLDAFLLLPQSGSSYNSDGSKALTIEDVVMALPPVTAWDALGKLLDDRQAANPSAFNASLALFGTLLRDDPAASAKATATLLELVDKDTTLESYEKRYIRSNLKRFTDALPNAAIRKMSPAEQFSEVLSEAEKEKGSGGYSYLPIPDLTDGVDPATATSLIMRALQLGTQIDTDHPGTHRLVVDTATKRLDDISNPPWYLIKTVEDIPLYEALLRKYPAKAPGGQETSDDDDRESAEERYVGLLAFAGRKAEAKALLEKIASSRKVESLFDEIDASPEQRKIAFDLLYEVLPKHPDLPYWRQLSDYIGNPSDEQRVLTLQAEVLAGGRVRDKEVRKNLEDQRVSMLLESGRTDEALRELAQFTGEARKLTQENHSAQRLNELLVRTALVGDLLGREDTSKAAMDELATTIGSGSESFDTSTLRLFEKHQRLAPLEKVIGERLLKLSSSGDGYSNINETNNLLHQLAWLYDAANRPQDVIRLLDEAPLWIGKDVADLRNAYGVHLPMDVIAAKAFAATGKRELALKIIKDAIIKNPGQDAAYEVLLSLNDGGTMAFLDEAFAENRFEERPLIWKAKLLSDEGKLDEAEKTIRQAIAIDPSDGEQGKGDRMRAYRVLGGIFDKRGDKEQAKFMESIDKAIRTAEEADDWWAAGIHTQAVKRYESALLSFADAYCIQSRLALRYAEMGDMDKAAQYYQRAFELMPDSFGRVESHCFGCEGAFRGSLAQGIAERVFTSLAAKPPVKPQVYYLLGYLRESQDRPKEAAEFYRKAVEADPDYLNAWQKLIGVADKGGLKPEEVDQALLASYRLSGTARFDGFSNLRLLWKTLSEEQKSGLVPAKTLYPLTASALRINANPSLRQFVGGHHQASPPREAFAEISAIQQITSLIQQFARKN